MHRFSYSQSLAMFDQKIQKSQENQQHYSPKFVMLPYMISFLSLTSFILEGWNRGVTCASDVKVKVNNVTFDFLKWNSSLEIQRILFPYWKWSVLEFQTLKYFWTWRKFLNNGGNIYLIRKMVCENKTFLTTLYRVGTVSRLCDPKKIYRR